LQEKNSERKHEKMRSRMPKKKGKMMAKELKKRPQKKQEAVSVESWGTGYRQERRIEKRDIILPAEIRLSTGVLKERVASPKETKELRWAERQNCKREKRKNFCGHIKREKHRNGGAKTLKSLKHLRQGGYGQ